MERDTRHRKYLLTINNPGSDWTHDKVRAVLDTLHLKYWCMADEIGLQEQTPHTHIFFVTQTSAIRFSTVKGLFPTAHVDPSQGTCEENRAYIQKSGKWAADEKADTAVADTFEEWGELPNEPGAGYRSDLAELYYRIEAGYSNAEIMAENPDTAQHIGKMDKIRQDILEAKYRDTFRKLKVTYIYGPTATGKTRGVYQKHGYSSVYRVTDYKHPFDRYAQEPILCFDEFRSSMPMGEMLNYLDGYPISLPARYAPRVACYETVYIVSNIDLKQQYQTIQVTEPETWKAFLRRIHSVVEYRKDMPPVERRVGLEYLFPTIPRWVREAERLTGEAGRTAGTPF